MTERGWGMTDSGVAVWRAYTRGKRQVVLLTVDAERGDNFGFAFRSGAGRAGGMLFV